MSIDRPLVSICIPVYNGEQTIERCLKAVLAQNVEDSEIIVVDNHSTDRTVEIAKVLLDGVANARVIVNETNIGRIQNWNRCIEIAGGKYLKFALANDALLKGSVKTLLEVALKDEKIVIVSSMHRFASAIPEDLEEMAPPKSRQSLNRREAIELVNQGGDPFWALNGMLMKLEPVLTNGLRFREDLPYIGDKYFMLQLSSYGRTVFLESASYLFNTQATSRFHFAGMKPDTFLPEYAQFVDEVGRLFHLAGGMKFRKYQLLIACYKSFLHEQNIAIGFPLTRKLFAGSQWFLARAGWERFLYETRLKAFTIRLCEDVKEKLPVLTRMVRFLKRKVGVDRSSVIDIQMR